MDQNQNNKENYKFFSHRECEFFPCHKVSDEESFNCLFCYCPLYALGKECGGNFTYTENGGVTRKTTESKVLDMFAVGGAYRERSDEDVILLFNMF